MILCELIKEIYVCVSARPHPGDSRLLTHLLLCHLSSQPPFLWKFQAVLSSRSTAQHLTWSKSHFHPVSAKRSNKIQTITILQFNPGNRRIPVRKDSPPCIPQPLTSKELTGGKHFALVGPGWLAAFSLTADCNLWWEQPGILRFSSSTQWTRKYTALRRKINNEIKLNGVAGPFSDPPF